MELKVLSLNCWGVFIPLSCKLRGQRINAIGLELGRGEYDIAILQEVWCEADYKVLCLNAVTAMPYTHYFHSGNFGSGVCIFSKHLIHDTFQHRYTLNGYPHRIFCSDWYGGKLIGLARVLVGELRINVYGTHLHAQYYEPDDYEAHRIAQSFEMSQFINETSAASCDIVIVGGDFNYRPDQLGYKVIRYNANLDDSWVARKEKPNGCSEYELTCDRPDNIFSSPSPHHPQGVTLDYIMFRQQPGYSVRCEKCYLAMQKMSDNVYNYSDHEGVAAVFTVERNTAALVKRKETGEIEKHLGDVLPILDEGIRRSKSSKVFYAVASFLIFTSLIFTANVGIPSCLDIIVNVAQFILVFVLSFCLAAVLVGTGRELNGLTSVRNDVVVSLRSMHID